MGNRVKRFFDPLPKYDVAQLQTYLYLLDAPEGELVEHLRTKKVLKTHSTLILRDEEMFDELLKPKLLDFSDRLALSMDNRELQRQFLLAEDGKVKIDIIQTI